MAWLDARIAETEARISAEKNMLAKLENNGLNLSHCCRRLALSTDYLQILYIRRSAVLAKFSEVD